MNDKLVPKYKMTDALPDSEPADESGAPEPSSKGPEKADLKQHNAEVNQGLGSNKERLVDIGRGDMAAGRS